RLLRGVADLTGAKYDPSEEAVAALIAGLGSTAPLVAATVRNTSNPTVVAAGYKTNVVPDEAVGYVDTRFLPGQQEQVLRQVEQLAGPHVKVEHYITERSLEVPFDAT